MKESDGIMVVSGAGKLVDCIDKLKPAHKTLLIACAKEYLREDFHAGLLPFLRTTDAIRFLKRRREELKATHDRRLVRLITITINIILKHASYAGSYAIHEDEIHRTLYLSDGDLSFNFGSRFGKKFCVYLKQQAHISKDASLFTAQLERIACDQWRVTAHPAVMNDMIDYLLKYFQAR